MSTELYRLMTWLSPSFPVGSFSYSHGLEYLVECGAVPDEGSLLAWTRDVLRLGSGKVDAVLFSSAYRASDDGDLRTIAELAAALAPSPERHLETTGQGNAFADTVGAVWSSPRLARLRAELDVAYPVAVALAAREHDISVRPALLAYLHAFAASLVSAGVRLIPLGQTAGQRIIAALEPVVASVAADAEQCSLDDIGSALLLTDMASMRHETQYTRLFRS